MSDGRATVVLYRHLQSAPLLTTVAVAAMEGGTVHAHGPPLHDDTGADVAVTIEQIARARGAEARVWDGDAPSDAAGVHRLCTEVSAQLLVAEWQPRIVDGHLDLARQVMDDPPCDVLAVRPGSLSRIEQVCVAVGPGPNAPLVAGCADRMAKLFGMSAEALRGVDADADLGAAEELCARLAPGLPTRIEVGRDLVNLLIDAADQHGLLALGASEDVPLDRLGVRTVGTRLAHHADATIIVGRTAPEATPTAP
jgi:hypothetical protein